MTTVMIFGTFDLLHAGHMAVLKQARRHGDHLVVVIARDSRVKNLKGKASVHTERERHELLSHIDLVDEVVLGDRHDVYKIIKTRRPDVIALGYDQTAFVDKLISKLKEFNLKTEIVRLKPYKPTTRKSSKIKSHLAHTL